MPVFQRSFEVRAPLADMFRYRARQTRRLLEKSDGLV
jgi:hypothetical protein